MTDHPIFRFAPSPNGKLHLGHAYSALTNWSMARKMGGKFLLRMEDIDTVRCTAAFEALMLFDLEWLGIEWDGPVRRQSNHFDLYREHLERLYEEGLVYRSSLSRGDIARIVESHEETGAVWPRDPDSAPLFPGRRYEGAHETGSAYGWRLNMEKAIGRVRGALGWYETGCGPDGQSGVMSADPSVWGDVMLVRRDTPTSYHLSVVVDDALQGVTHVVRGQDLFESTSVHVLLQELFGFSRHAYHHHELILADDGQKLSKSRQDTAIADLRQAGATPSDIYRMIGFKDPDA